MIFPKEWHAGVLCLFVFFPAANLELGEERKLERILKAKVWKRGVLEDWGVGGGALLAGAE